MRIIPATRSCKRRAIAQWYCSCYLGVHPIVVKDKWQSCSKCCKLYWFLKHKLPRQLNMFIILSLLSSIINALIWHILSVRHARSWNIERLPFVRKKKFWQIVLDLKTFPKRVRVVSVAKHPITSGLGLKQITFRLKRKPGTG